MKCIVKAFLLLSIMLLLVNSYERKKKTNSRTETKLEYEMSDELFIKLYKFDKDSEKCIPMLKKYPTVFRRVLPFHKVTAEDSSIKGLFNLIELKEIKDASNKKTANANKEKFELYFEGYQKSFMENFPVDEVKSAFLDLNQNYVELGVKCQSFLYDRKIQVVDHTDFLKILMFKLNDDNYYNLNGNYQFIALSDDFIKELYSFTLRKQKDEALFEDFRGIFKYHTSLAEDLLNIQKYQLDFNLLYFQEIYNTVLNLIKNNKNNITFPKKVTEALKLTDDTNKLDKLNEIPTSKQSQKITYFCGNYHDVTKVEKDTDFFDLNKHKEDPSLFSFGLNVQHGELISVFSMPVKLLVGAHDYSKFQPYDFKKVFFKSIEYGMLQKNEPNAAFEEDNELPEIGKEVKKVEIPFDPKEIDEDELKKIIKEHEISPKIKTQIEAKWNELELIKKIDKQISDSPQLVDRDIFVKSSENIENREIYLKTIKYFVYKSNQWMKKIINKITQDCENKDIEICNNEKLKPYEVIIKNTRNSIQHKFKNLKDYYYDGHFPVVFKPFEARKKPATKEFQALHSIFIENQKFNIQAISVQEPIFNDNDDYKDSPFRDYQLVLHHPHNARSFILQSDLIELIIYEENGWTFVKIKAEHIYSMKYSHVLNVPEIYKLSLRADKLVLKFSYPSRGRIKLLTDSNVFINKTNLDLKGSHKHLENDYLNENFTNDQATLIPFIHNIKLLKNYFKDVVTYDDGLRYVPKEQKEFIEQYEYLVDGSGFINEKIHDYTEANKNAEINILNTKQAKSYQVVDGTTANVYSTKPQFDVRPVYFKLGYEAFMPSTYHYELHNKIYGNFINFIMANESVYKGKIFFICIAETLRLADFRSQMTTNRFDFSPHEVDHRRINDYGVYVVGSIFNHKFALYMSYLRKVRKIMINNLYQGCSFDDMIKHKYNQEATKAFREYVLDKNFKVYQEVANYFDRNDENKEEGKIDLKETPKNMIATANPDPRQLGDKSGKQKVQGSSEEDEIRDEQPKGAIPSGNIGKTGPPGAKAVEKNGGDKTNKANLMTSQAASQAPVPKNKQANAEPSENEIKKKILKSMNKAYQQHKSLEFMLAEANFFGNNPHVLAKVNDKEFIFKIDKLIYSTDSFKNNRFYDLIKCIIYSYRLEKKIDDVKTFFPNYLESISGIEQNKITNAITFYSKKSDVEKIYPEYGKLFEKQVYRSENVNTVDCSVEHCRQIHTSDLGFKNLNKIYIPIQSMMNDGMQSDEQMLKGKQNKTKNLDPPKEGEIIQKGNENETGGRKSRRERKKDASNLDSNETVAVQQQNAQQNTINVQTPQQLLQNQPTTIQNISGNEASSIPEHPKNSSGEISTDGKRRKLKKLFKK